MDAHAARSGLRSKANRKARKRALTKRRDKANRAATKALGKRILRRGSGKHGGAAAAPPPAQKSQPKKPTITLTLSLPTGDVARLMTAFRNGELRHIGVIDVIPLEP
jgi:hypothetical protein